MTMVSPSLLSADFGNLQRDIEMLIAKERAEGLSEQERQVLIKLITSKEMQKKQLVNPQ